MKPVEQTVTELGKGNCVAACIASILELPIERMPNFHGSYWEHEWCKWLAVANLTLTEVPRGGTPPLGLSILAAESPRNPVLHAVVVSDGNIVWDPHPRRDMGVGQGHSRYLVHALNPVLPVNLSALEFAS